MKSFMKAFSGTLFVLAILWTVFLLAAAIYTTIDCGTWFITSWSYLVETRTRVDGVMQLVAAEGLYLPVWAHLILLSGVPMAGTILFRRHCRKF